MKKGYKRGTLKVIVFVMVCLLFLPTCSAWALDFSGEAGGGDGQGRRGQGSGFALIHASPDCDANSIVGYRFSIYDINNVKRGKTIDIIRNGWKANGSWAHCTSTSCAEKDRVLALQFGYNGYSLVDLEGNQMDKLSNQDAFQNKEGYRLVETKNNKYLESAIGGASYFPIYTSLATWFQKDQNVQAVVKLCLGVFKKLNYGDKVLVEPIFSCFVEHYSCGLTVSDLARLSYFYYGDKFPEGVSGAYEFAWIRNWALKTFPSMLYVSNAAVAEGAGLTAGKQLYSGVKPSQLLNGAYGMVICTELSKSKEAPALKIEEVSVYKGNTLIQRHSLKEDFVYEYLKPGENYRILVKASEETSPYLCRVSVHLTGATENVISFKALSNESWEFGLIATGDEESICLEITEDWISENEEVRQEGERATFYLPTRPNIRSEITIRDLDGRELPRVFEGQRVQIEISSVNESPWLSKESEFENEISIQNGEEFGTDVFSWTLPVNEKNTKIYEVVAKGNIDVTLQTKWKEKGVNMDTMEMNASAYKADLEVIGLTLVNEQGEALNHNNIPVGKIVWPEVVVKTNTETPLNVAMNLMIDGETYEAMKSILEGEYQTVRMKSISFVEEKEYQVSAGVYLVDVAGDLSVEETECNNEKTLQVTVREPLQISPFETGTALPKETVVSSIFVNNQSFEDFTGKTKVWFRVLREDGSIAHCDSTGLIVPQGESTYVPFVWTVPEDAKDGEELAYQFEVMLYEKSERIKEVTGHLKIQAAYYSEEENKDLMAPANINQLNEIQKRLNQKYNGDEASKGTVTWHFWKYSDGMFVRDEYCLTYALCGQIVSVPWGNKTDEGYVIRSGRDMVLGANMTIALTKNQKKSSDYSFVTGNKKISFVYYENGFRETEGKCTQKSGAECEIVHFTPVWTPDGEYTVFFKGGSVWTPAGEVIAINKTSCTIKGSLFDDYFVTR